jgi:hypothetical protein
LVNDQRDAQTPFYVFIFIFNSACFEHIVFIIRFSQPAQDTITKTERQLPEVVLTQFISPDDEHDVLQTCRVKNKNKYIERNLCVTLVIYQESLHDAGSTKYEI